jgi:hypothetical protein
VARQRLHRDDRMPQEDRSTMRRIAIRPPRSAVRGFATVSPDGQAGRFATDEWAIGDRRQLTPWKKALFVRLSACRVFDLARRSVSSSQPTVGSFRPDREACLTHQARRVSYAARHDTWSLPAVTRSAAVTGRTSFWLRECSKQQSTSRRRIRDRSERDAEFGCKFRWDISIKALDARSAPRDVICVRRRDICRDCVARAASIASSPRQTFTLNDGEHAHQISSWNVVF